MNLILYADGYLKAGDKIFAAAYGRNGIGVKSREGDDVSPEGRWNLRQAFYRPDRLLKPVTGLPLDAITPDHAWCDIQGDPCYNQLVMLPYPAINEKLWREDHLYDLVVVIGYNDEPVIDGKGSAIFLHVARPDYSPSAGCACVALPDLLEILSLLNAQSTLTFTQETFKNEQVKQPYNPSASASI